LYSAKTWRIGTWRTDKYKKKVKTVEMNAMKRSMHISRRDKTRNERMIRKQKWE